MNKDLLQQALTTINHALKAFGKICPSSSYAQDVMDECDVAIEALEAAIAQPVQPVAGALINKGSIAHPAGTEVRFGTQEQRMALLKASMPPHKAHEFALSIAQPVKPDSVLTEREECALVAERGFKYAYDGDKIADAIRARSQS